MKRQPPPLLTIRIPKKKKNLKQDGDEKMGEKTMIINNLIEKSKKRSPDNELGGNKTIWFIDKYVLSRERSLNEDGMKALKERSRLIRKITLGNPEIEDRIVVPMMVKSTQEFLYTYMEKCDKEDLFERFDRDKLYLLNNIEQMETLMHVVSTLHQHDYCCLDIKDENILINLKTFKTKAYEL